VFGDCPGKRDQARYDISLKALDPEEVDLMRKLFALALLALVGAAAIAAPVMACPVDAGSDHSS
jgi:hypothetical protein